VAEESCWKRKDRTQGNHGSRRKSAVTCRKVSHHAKGARQKRKLVRRMGTQENCGPRKELTATGMRKSMEGSDGKRNRDVKEPPYLRKKRTTNSRMERWTAILSGKRRNTRDEPI
jgi:hypothetical protein